jgi:hypothetical protein
MVTPAVRVVIVRPRTILLVLGIAVLVGLVLALGYLAWHVVTWILIAMLLAAALNPAVEALERRGMRRSFAGRSCSCSRSRNPGSVAGYTRPRYERVGRDIYRTISGYGDHGRDT